MYTDTEGIIFKQTKTVNGRRMILLFSFKYGKISAGTGIDERSKGKAALAMRPFTYGKYEMFKNRNSYNINGAEVIRSYYRIGEDVDKYMICSYILEFTEKLLMEEQPAPELFRLLISFLEIMEQRKSYFETMVLAYQLKALAICGHMPHIDSCVRCGNGTDLSAFDVKEGGLICKDCVAKYNSNGTLIYKVDFGIVNILKYFLSHPLRDFEKLALDSRVEKELRTILKSYIDYHLDLGKLKSEGFLPD